MKILGIDEAGRGPIIGPMVMAGVLIEEETNEKFLEMGVKDSKLLLPAKREGLFPHIIKKSIAHEIVIISAKEIDDALLSPTSNLNWLEANTTAYIINKLKPERAIIDSPSNNIKAYKEYLMNHIFDPTIELVVEHKADVNHPSVAAASILAKVRRDEEVERIKKMIGIDFGSGYMSDPKTKEFLEKNWSKFSAIFRKTWAPYKEIEKRRNQARLGDF
ncbi:MAG: ribonuclease HII [Nanoarchaeota archaeon]|nr:ribonuclease HII [Nanoarchaeota archaeon]